MVTRFVQTAGIHRNFLERSDPENACSPPRNPERDQTFDHGKSRYEKPFRMFPIEGTRFKIEALHDLIANPFYRSGTTNIPAGMTYLGQFIAHDITHLNISSDVPGIQSRPIDSLDQLATPSLDLGGLYGDVEGFGHHVRNQGGRFISQFTHEFGVNKVIYDIPRDVSFSHVSYEIGDARNDENFITAQLHVLFMNLHNKLVDIHEAQLGRSKQDAFEYARKEATLLYQRVVLNDFLCSFLHETVYKNLFSDSPFDRFMKFTKAEEPRIPVEFSGAAFRFGHSLVRPEYVINSSKKPISMHGLFNLTGKGGRWSEIKTGNHIVEWPFLLDMTKYACAAPFQKTMPIDLSLAPGLHKMRNEAADNQDLSHRNQVRGNELDLPCGQDIVDFLWREKKCYAAAMGLEKIDPAKIDPNEINDSAKFLKIAEKWNFSEKMPLWAYLLTESHFQEAEKAHKKLGVLGSIIVGEVFKNLLEGSRTSIYYDEIKNQESAFHWFLKNKLVKDVNFKNAKMSDLAFFTYY